MIPSAVACFNLVSRDLVIPAITEYRTAPQGPSKDVGNSRSVGI